MYVIRKMSGVSPSKLDEWMDHFMGEVERVIWSYNLNVVDPSEFFNYKCKRHQSEREVKEWERRKLKECDFAVIDLTDINDSVGSHFELAWAQMYDIPVLAIGSTENVHPWILDCCERVEANCEDLFIYINEYYLS